MTDLATSSTGNKYLTFLIGNTHYGLATSFVREIVLNLPFEPLPEVPKFVRGLTIIRGEYIPIVDMAIMLGSDSFIEIQKKSCFIIALLNINGYQSPIALLINEVKHAKHVADTAINPSPVIGEKIQVPYVDGITFLTQNEQKDISEVCVLLNINALFENYLGIVEKVLRDNNDDKIIEDSDTPSRQQSQKNRNSTSSSNSSLNIVTKIKYISIIVDQFKFAVPSNLIKKIIRSDYEKINAEYPDFMLTVGLIEGQPTGIIRLSDFINRDEIKSNEIETTGDTNNDVVIVLNMNNTSIGIAVDNVGQCYDINIDEIGSSDFCDQQRRNWIKSLGFINTDEGRLEIIDLCDIFSTAELATLKKWNNSINTIQNINKATSQDKPINNLKSTDSANKYAQFAGYYLIIRVGDALVAINNKIVREVTQSTDVLQLANTQSDLKGILTIRKNTYPVIDLSSKLGVDNIHSEDYSECIVLIEDPKNINNNIGLIASHVLECRRFSPAEVNTNTDGTLYIHPACLNAVVSSEQGPIHLINMDEILQREIIAGDKLMASLKNN